MNINLGMGTHRAPAPWVNVDSDPRHRPDLLADVGRLPLVAASVDALYAGHLLEHVPLPAVAAVLEEWRRVLRPGGVLMLVGPDIDRAVRTRQPEWLLDAIIAHASPPGGHAWTCSERVVLWLLEAGGWDAEALPVAEVCAPEWPNPVPEADWQFAVRSTC